MCKEYGHSLYDCYQLGWYILIICVQFNINFNTNTSSIDTPTTDDLPATMIHAAAISTAFNIAMEQLAEKAGDTAEWPATKAELLAEQAAFNAAEAKMWSVAVERAATAAEAFANASDYLEKKNE